MYGKFLVEGDKLVSELLQSNFKTDTVYSVDSWQLKDDRNKVRHSVITYEELKRISTHENPNKVIAVAEMPNSKFIVLNSIINSELVLACDNINDPGNAGTLIRIADWFGVNKIFFSENSVDIYNPKVVNASKGSLFRVSCFFTDLKKLFQSNAHLKVYGTFTGGKNIYQAKLPEHAFVLVGNEAIGISKELTPFIHEEISIPSFGKAESLNVSVATGIVLSEFKRKGLF